MKNKLGRQATEWEKIFAKDISDNGLLSKIYKEPLKFNNKNKQQPNLKMDKRSEHFTEEEIQMANKYEKMLNIICHQGIVN